MAFVKVVGRSEIYNFRIQRFVHLYSKMEFFNIKYGCTVTVSAGASLRHDVARARAQHPSASALEATVGRSSPLSQATHLP
jgi:hypothetical protein